MAHFRPVFHFEKNMPIQLAQCFPKLQWMHRSHCLFICLRVKQSDSSTMTYTSPRCQMLGDMVQGTGWGKVLPKRERKVASVSPASCISPPQGCQRHTGSWWTDRAGVNTSSHHQTEVLQLGVQPCARTLCDASSWGASPAQVAPAASPLRGFPRHTAYCKQLLLIKS